MKADLAPVRSEMGGSGSWPSTSDQKVWKWKLVIHERYLSVSCERMCTILGNRLED